MIDRTYGAWETLHALEIVECDQCGFNDGFTSESQATVEGWTFTDRGTSCPECAETQEVLVSGVVVATYRKVDA